MKSFILMLGILFTPNLLSAQICDNFSDGDFIDSPEWIGDYNSFQITTSSSIPENMKPALQLNADTSKTIASLALPVTLTTTDSIVWEFWAKLSFTPSVNNFARFYLISNTENFNQAQNAYFVSLGENAKTLLLYKQEGTVLTPLITGLSISKTTNILRVKVKRSNTGLWQLWTDTTGAKNYKLQGTCSHQYSIDFKYSGIFCKYTKSNASKMYFDDICISPILPDYEKPFIEKVTLQMPNKLHLLFSEVVEETSAININNYKVNNGIGSPVSIEYEQQEVTLSFAEPFQTKVEYALITSNIFDMSGNEMAIQTATFLDYKIQPSDIIINEVLFHPKPNGVDFVEIYNNTTFNLSLENLCIATIDNVTNTLKSCTKIPAQTTFTPNDYLVLTTDPEDIKSKYIVKNQDKLLKLKTLPSFPNEKGTVILALTDSTVIDRFDYSEKMHFPLLKETTGISLERRNPDKPTNESSNWHSAAQTVGWATPSYQNSQYNQFLYLQEPFTIAPAVFSPDNDGVDDLLNISYKMDNSGYIMNLIVFDANGNPIKYLKRNALLSVEGTLVWDGTTEQNRKAPIGIYVIYIEVFNTNGDKKSYKKAITLSGR